MGRTLIERGEKIPWQVIRTQDHSGAKELPAALKLSVSATVDDDRIFSILGENAATWSITVGNPHNDIMRRQDDLSVYKRHLRSMFDRIKAHHGENAVINVFPAVPVSLAVETGRTKVPKANLAMRIFDQSREAKAFVAAITIGR